MVGGVGLGLPLGWGNATLPRERQLCGWCGYREMATLPIVVAPSGFLGWCGCVKGAAPERLLGIS